MGPIRLLSDRKLYMPIPFGVNKEKEIIGQVMWAKHRVRNIFEVSFYFPESGGYQTWFCEARREGGFIPIECAQYMGAKTLAILIEEEGATIDELLLQKEE